MKLTTTETKQYAHLAVKASTGGMSTNERTQYDALVGKMAKPEPRKGKTKKPATSRTTAKK